ncbi:hypothetical protein Plim_0075 [Planctopirus limnophila DSM 3776]|uniref:Glycoside hydrolase family 38 N-terminal domain-containing protein n=1 Tax=Planctopirus limnophila (strain ATCC 43296 / DSM 3776 / IFAM 1008 / Mu 290) TaxID=521674 RepID=D5SMK8_PLAL2|nr:hypothetical protein [Planctopirus limnophila]ADG65928.1 hypothetical protein Plim_0075 [Planctopirus limnophila DSM 3776]
MTKTCSEVYVLIPSHSLEDFPQDLGEEAAGSLLEAFAIAWHPALLATAGRIPQWYRADAPPEPAPGQLLILPQPSEDWFPYDWHERLEQAGAGLLKTVARREDNLQQLQAWLESDADDSAQPSLFFQPEAKTSIDDFLAFGTTVLQLELLSRQMRHFSSLDEIILQQRTVGAARSLAAGEFLPCRQQLATAYENLLETRERFYPGEISLFDLCLAPSELDMPRLKAALNGFTWPVNEPLGNQPAVNFLAGSLETSPLLKLADEQLPLAAPQELTAPSNTAPTTTLKELLAQGAVDVLGGEAIELCTPLISPQMWIRNFQQGHLLAKTQLGIVPRVFARRLFGLVSQLPGLLSQTGYAGALHLLLDEGTYPDEEFSSFRWEGTSGEAVTAFSRIPLPAQSAGTFLRLATRLGEALDSDGNPALGFARWPEVATPWFHDLQRAATFAPVLGKFVTCKEFLERVEYPDHVRQYHAGEYLSSSLVYAVAAREKNAISRVASAWKLQGQQAAWQFCEVQRALLSPSENRQQPVQGIKSGGQRWEDELLAHFRVIGASDNRATTDHAANADEEWSAETALQQTAQQFANLLGSKIQNHEAAASPAGTLLINPLPWARPVPEEMEDGTFPTIPPCGYLWLAQNTPNGKSPARKSKPVVKFTEGVLSNDLFEVVFHPQTGGIARIRRHEQRENRLSLQLARRFPRERAIRLGPDPDDEVIKTAYSEMRAGELSIIALTSHSLTVRSLGDLIDQAKGERICYYKLDVTIRAGSLKVEIDLQFLELAAFDGDPWNNYIGARFAFGSEMAAISRSVLGSVHVAGSERFEAPEFVEICDGSLRATILPHGRPYFRKTGPRMLDGLMVVSGETSRRFRWTIAIDDPHPARLAHEAMVPLVRLENVTRPATGETSFFVQCPAKQVSILSWEAGMTDWPIEAPADPSDTESVDRAAKATVSKKSCRVRLMETEGQAKTFSMVWYAPLAGAHKLTLGGAHAAWLKTTGNESRVALSAYEVADIEFVFE